MGFQFQCPHCQAVMQCEDEWQNMQAQCPLCRKSVILRTVSSIPGYSKQNHFSPTGSQQSQEEELSRKQIILIYATMMIPLFNIVTMITTGRLYYRWRKQYPLKAKQVNVHGILAFCAFLGFWYPLGAIIKSLTK